MGVIRSRPRIAQGLASTITGQTADTQQVRRMVQSIPKPEPASGGIEGITRASAWSLSTFDATGKIICNPAGTFDVVDLSGEGPSVSQTSNYLTVTEAGFYLVTVDAWLSFTGTAPEYVQFTIDHTGSDYHFPRRNITIYDDLLGNGPDAVDTWTVGPLAIPAAGSLYFGAAWPGSNVDCDVNYWSLDIAKVG